MGTHARRRGLGAHRERAADRVPPRARLHAVPALAVSRARRGLELPPPAGSPEPAPDVLAAGYSPELITASVSPLATEAPTAIGSSATVPDLCAVISFSIF